MIKEPLLVLNHSEHECNLEEWYLSDDEQIFVISDCPTNYPKHTEHTMTVQEALRQYAMMVSPTEGWEVFEDNGWRDFIMEFGSEKE